MHDLELGAFSDHGPWEVELDRLSWRAGLDHVRRAVRAEVPALVTPKKLPPGSRVAVTLRHLGLGLAIWAAGKRKKGGTESVADLSRRLRRAAERLGPAYIKLGQIISSGEGVFPEPLVTEFKKCRDQVPPETWETVRRVVEEDLGRPLEAVFARFER
ncbi:MAG TPA: AarF/ABC1/UbiB kinase family protein, partial [Acidimicrobiia bacterium]|nr:AarF/ABC1/UbiB kinase family protein [Acidimicrobiia bacterium]